MAIATPRLRLGALGFTVVLGLVRHMSALVCLCGLLDVSKP